MKAIRVNCPGCYGTGCNEYTGYGCRLCNGRGHTIMWPTPVERYIQAKEEEAIEETLDKAGL